MSDSDPRPMPVEIQRAYRETIDLLGLLKSSAFSRQEQEDVRDELLRALLEKHGEVWILVGRKEQTLSRKARSYREPLRAIELMLDVPDYGGREETLPMLAQLMQPTWASWWNAWNWRSEDDASDWTEGVSHVLGPRQFRWLAAQYARTVIDLTRLQDRAVCLRGIEAAEAWARAPVREGTKAADALSDTAAAISDAAEEAYDDVVDGESAYAAYAALAAASIVSEYPNRFWAFSAIRSAAATRSAIASYPRLCELTKSLITPALVTRPTRSASGSSRR